MSYSPNFFENQFRCPTKHYEIKVAGKRLLYAYIRKNACTSFKGLINRKLHPRFVVKQIILGNRKGRYDIGGNMKYYSVKNNAQFKIDTYDEIIFVHRDPVSRFISVFTNKFIDNVGAEGIKNNFETLMNISFEEATFNDFMNYSKNEFSELDCHMWPQKSHLWDIDYSLPIPIDDLASVMSNSIGKNIAEKWFGRKINFSRSDGKEVLGYLDRRTVRELRKLQRKGYSIQKNNFMIHGLENFIQDRYEMDFHMIAASGNG
ncbi:MAG: sulfotransferase family 2 domain-containing protein [Pseudomonadota bacterium]|nr:sulfotransferase family 2 domain-containing protein [Pseudomonadota bacterium]